MPNLFGLDIAALINTNIQQAGGVLTATLLKVTHGTRDPLNPSAGRQRIETSHTGNGFIEDYNEFQIDNTLVQRGDRRIILLGASISGSAIPEPNDQITIESVTYNIVNVERDPAAATYTCQCRKPS